jgi:hypothetical protein
MQRVFSESRETAVADEVGSRDDGVGVCTQRPVLHRDVGTEPDARRMDPLRLRESLLGFTCSFR